METLWQDIRYGIRMLAKTPGFTLIAILTLTLGIGANTALFSVVNAVLLNPLPYPQPDQLLAVFTKTANFGHSSVSYPNLLDWQKDNRSFSYLVGTRGDDFNLTGNGAAERLRTGMVSAGYFELLGAKPLMGRTFTPEEDRVGAPPVVVITEGLWKRKFGSGEVIGKTMALSGTDYTVIGVVPANSRLYRNNEIYVPIGQWSDVTFRDRRVSMGMQVVGRLKPGVKIEQARADMDAIAAGLAATYPEADAKSGIALVPLKKNFVGDIEPFLYILLGAVGFVLLIACANVANLLLARSSARIREFAVRSALGASRGRIIRQLLTESVLLSIAGGGLGLALAAWGTRAVIRTLPDALPRSEGIGVDTRVLLFTLFISVLAGILFGLAPALRTLQPNLQETLKEGGRGASGARHRAQGVFVAAEMALAMVLLVGAGLMIRSLALVWGVDPGFNPHHVTAFDIAFAPSMASKPPAAVRGFFRELGRQISAIPSVEAFSTNGGSLPMEGDSELPFYIDGQPKPASDNEMSWSLFYLVDPPYLKTMGIPLKRGRFITDHDDDHAPMVMVIDETFAKKYFPHDDPIGKRINLTLLGQAEIIGVVGHIKHWGLDSDAQQVIQAQFYMPFLQVPDKFMPLIVKGGTFVLRSNAEPKGLGEEIRRRIGQMDSQHAMYGIRTLDEIVSDSLATRRFSTILLDIFAGLALLLAAVGIYGVIAYLVGQRTHEIGVRMALGAQRTDVLRLILGQGSRIALVGVGIGLAAAFGLTRLMNKMLFGVSATDPITFGGVAMLLVMVALAACYIPARRAMRVDPIVALRYE
jgi:predicted permease